MDDGDISMYPSLFYAFQFLISDSHVPVFQIGARVEAVGFAVTETFNASSSGCSIEKAVIEKSASRPLPSPSLTKSAIGVLLK